MGLELVIRRWSWPGTHGKPVFNLRSEGRKFTNRCLAIADGFYEFTAPDDPKAKRKNKWLFSPVEGELHRHCRGYPDPSRKSARRSAC